MITTPFINEIASQLLTRFSDRLLCQQYAWWIVEAVTQKSRAALLSNVQIITQAEQQIIADKVAQLITSTIPLQYILGSVPFINLEINVQPPVLIPRHETEEWVAMLIELLQPYKHTPLRILDIGTGSGCIALALAKALPQATVYATDIVQNNLVLAQHNALKNSIHTVHFILSDLFASIKMHAPFDLIVSNPPYIGIQEKPILDVSVTDWEDPRALFAQEEGYHLIRLLIEQAKYYLNPKHIIKDPAPELVIEIGHNQAHQTIALAKKNQYGTIQVWQDAGRKDRLVMLRV